MKLSLNIKFVGCLLLGLCLHTPLLMAKSCPIPTVNCNCASGDCACGPGTCACANAQCACTDPQCACLNAQCACTDPQCACGDEQCQCPPGGLMSFGGWYLPRTLLVRFLLPGDNVLFSTIEVASGITALSPDATGGTTFTLTNSGVGTYYVNVGLIARTGSRDEYSVQLNSVTLAGGILNASPNFALDPIALTFQANNGDTLTVTYTGPGFSTMGGGGLQGNEANIVILQIQ